MTTTYSNPKEMLGYIIVQQINSLPELVRLFPYDRKAVFSYYYWVRGLDSQLVSFRDDMFLFDEEENKIVYRDAIKQIRGIISQEWNNVYSKDYDKFVEAVYVWAELIASCYPKLGLVPETGFSVGATEDHIIDQDKIEKEEAQDEDSEEVDVNESDSPVLSNRERKSEPEPVKAPQRKPTGFVFQR